MNDVRVPGSALAARLLRAATFAYPVAFRRRFASEMQCAFEARCSDSWRDRGHRGLAAAVSRTLLDVIRAGLGERLDRRRPASAPGPHLRPDPPDRVSMFSSTLQDVRFAARLLRKNPGFTLVAVLTLALGIGANTAIFTLVDSLLGRPLPGIQDPDSLFALYTADSGGSPGISSIVDYRDFAEQLDTVSGIAAYKPRQANVSNDGVTEQLSSMMVTGSYFEVVGVAAVIGRTIGPEDDIEPDGHPVGVISYGLWQRRFAGDPAVIGSELRVNGRAFTIIGVTPRGFRGTWLESGPDLFVPMAMQPTMMPGNGNLLDRRGWGGVLVLGRRADGQSMEAVRDEVGSVGEWLRTTFTVAQSRDYQIVSFAEGTMIPEARTMVMQLSTLLFVVAGLVLLIACVNVANLLLARAAKRTREIAVRQALGAGRRRIVSQLMAESLLLSGLGGVVGIGVGAFLARAVGQLPVGLAIDTGLDQRVLLFCAAVTLITGVAFGLVPARRAARLDVTSRLRDGGQNASARRGFSSLLVVVQVAISIVLLVTAGLFGRTLANLSRVDLGFDSAVVTVGTDPGLQGYASAETMQFYDLLRERIAAMPGVQGVTYVDRLPGPNNDNVSSFALEGYAPEEGSRGPGAYFNLVGPDYFEVLSIPIVAGRGLGINDDSRAPAVVVINQSAADQLEQLVDRPAIGARLSFSGADGPWIEIVGIAANSMTSSVGAAPRANVYVPQRQAGGSSLAARMNLLVRAGDEPAAMIDEVLGTVRSLDPSLPVFNVGTLELHMSNALAQERLTAAAIGAAALLALSLALVGLYGILAGTVSSRSTELGVRMALGANAQHLVRLVLRHAAMLFAVGSVLGLAGSAALAQLVESFLFDVPALDLATYIGVLALMLVVSLAAAWIPARRATRLDPVRALRAE